MEKPGKDSKKVGKSSEEPGKAGKSLEKLERAWNDEHSRNGQK